MLIRKFEKIKAKTSTNLQPDPILRIELGLMFGLNLGYIFSNLIDLKFNRVYPNPIQTRIFLPLATRLTFL